MRTSSLNFSHNVVHDCQLCMNYPSIHYFWSYPNSIKGQQKNLLSNCIGIVEVDLQELMFFSMISIERTENRVNKKHYDTKLFQKSLFKEWDREKSFHWLPWINNIHKTMRNTKVGEKKQKTKKAKEFLHLSPGPWRRELILAGLQLHW